MVSDSNDETYFPYKLLLTGTQSMRLGKAFAKDSSTNIELSKTQLSRMVQLEEVFRDRAIFGNYLCS